MASISMRQHIWQQQALWGKLMTDWLTKNYIEIKPFDHVTDVKLPTNCYGPFFCYCWWNYFYSSNQDLVGASGISPQNLLIVLTFSLIWCMSSSTNLWCNFVGYKLHWFKALRRCVNSCKYHRHLCSINCCIVCKTVASATVVQHTSVPQQRVIVCISV